MPSPNDTNASTTKPTPYPKDTTKYAATSWWKEERKNTDEDVKSNGKGEEKTEN
jgi:hypothetical protein